MFKSSLHRVAAWLAAKTMPAALTGNQWTGTSFTDSFKRNRNPTPNELLAELKATAWTCASINASVCASFAPRLYVSTGAGQAAPKCGTKAIGRGLERQLRPPTTWFHTPRPPSAFRKSSTIRCLRCSRRSIRSTTPSTFGN